MKPKVRSNNGKTLLLQLTREMKTEDIRDIISLLEKNGYSVEAAKPIQRKNYNPNRRRNRTPFSLLGPTEPPTVYPPVAHLASVEEDTYSLQEYADLMKLPIGTIQTLIQQGKIQARKVEGEYVIPKSAVKIPNYTQSTAARNQMFKGATEVELQDKSEFKRDWKWETES